MQNVSMYISMYSEKILKIETAVSSSPTESNCMKKERWRHELLAFAMSIYHTVFSLLMLL